MLIVAPDCNIPWIVNHKRYEKDKDTYQYPSNTYYPNEYQKISPI